MSPHQEPTFNAPRGYLLTWSTYGTWLHGDDAGSVSRTNNHYGTPLCPPNAWLNDLAKRGLKYEPVTLCTESRMVVDRAIRDHAQFRGWEIAAVNIRTNHAHVVVINPRVRPEPILKQFKEWGTRRLRDAGLAPRISEVWTPHGSTRYLYEPGSVEAATHYVLHEQDSGRVSRNG